MCFSFAIRLNKIFLYVTVLISFDIDLSILLTVYGVIQFPTQLVMLWPVLGAIFRSILDPY